MKLTRKSLRIWSFGTVVAGVFSTALVVHGALSTYPCVESESQSNGCDACKPYILPLLGPKTYFHCTLAQDSGICKTDAGENVPDIICQTDRLTCPGPRYVYATEDPCQEEVESIEDNCVFWMQYDKVQQTAAPGVLCP